jgi:ABC-type branched-subunit amino acid transport system substrate-binding protein
MSPGAGGVARAFAARLGTTAAHLAHALARRGRALAATGRGRVALAALLAVVLAASTGVGLVLAATLGGSDEGGTPPTRVARIGVLAPLSGDLSDIGEAVRNAVQLAVEEANSSGAVPGWRIELSARDDLSRPDGGAGAADAFVGDDTTLGVVGPLSSTVAMVALRTLGAAGIPVVSPSNSAPALTGTDITPRSTPRTRPHPTYFRLTGTDDLQARAGAEYAVRTLGRSRIAVVDGGPDYGTTLAERFAADARGLGASVVSVHRVHGDSDDDFEVDATAAELREEAPELVYVATGYSFAGALRKRLASQRTTVQVLGADGLLNARYLDKAGSAADGDLVTDLGVPPSRLPGSGAFVAAYTRRWGGVQDGGGDSSAATLPTGGSTTAPASGAAAGDVTGSPEKPTVTVSERAADVIPAVAAYAYDAARALIRAAGSVLPGRPEIDAAARAAMVAEVGRGAFAGVTGRVAFDRWGDTKNPRTTVYTVLAGRFFPLQVAGG